MKMDAGYIKSCFLLIILIFFPLFQSYASEEDVSDKPYTQKFMGKCLELKEDVFFFKWNGSSETNIDLPTGSFLPASIEDYLSHPHDWEKTEEYAESIHHMPIENFSRVKVIGVLSKGTRLKVVKVVFVKKSSVTMHKTFVEILDGPFKGTISTTSLIYSSPYPYSENLGMNENALKFCEEPPSEKTQSKSNH